MCLSIIYVYLDEFISGGRMGCRRCTTIGTYVPERRRYYYNKFGEKYRSRPVLRTVEYTIEHGKSFDEAVTNREKSEIRMATGVCGLTIFFFSFIHCINLILLKM